MYEHVSQPLLPRADFVRRLIGHAGAAVLLIVGSLSVGVVGYAVLDDLPWIDAFVNASMILGGMGPVDPLKNDGAKLFAGLYALYSGVVFLISVGVFFAPLLHRILHRLHLQSLSDDDSADSSDSSDGAPASGGQGTSKG